MRVWVREWYCVDAICETPEGLADSPVQVAAKWVDGRLDWPKKADLLAVFQFAATVVDWRPGLLTGHYLVAMVVRGGKLTGPDCSSPLVAIGDR